MAHFLTRIVENVFATYIQFLDLRHNRLRIKRREFKPIIFFCKIRTFTDLYGEIERKVVQHNK